MSAPLRGLLALVVLAVAMLVGAGWPSVDALLHVGAVVGLGGVVVSLSLLGGLALTAGIVAVLSQADSA